MTPQATRCIWLCKQPIFDSQIAESLWEAYEEAISQAAALSANSGQSLVRSLDHWKSKDTSLQIRDEAQDLEYLSGFKIT